jgi:hypothetical protein
MVLVKPALDLCLPGLLDLGRALDLFVRALDETACHTSPLAGRQF